MSTRDELEVLHVRRQRALDALAADDAWLGSRLAAEAAAVRTQLERRDRHPPRRSTSQRVAAFGFQLLFVAPIVAMGGVALGRQLAGEPWLAVLCLVAGFAAVTTMMVPALSTRALHRTSMAWRVVSRIEALRRPSRDENT
jgi:hypothetical protein